MGELSEKTESLCSGTDVSLVVLGSDMRELLKKCDTTNTKLDTDIGNLKTENHGTKVKVERMMTNVDNPKGNTRDAQVEPDT